MFKKLKLKIEKSKKKEKKKTGKLHRAANAQCKGRGL